MFKIKLRVIQPDPDYPEDDSKNRIQNINLEVEDSRFIFVDTELYKGVGFWDESHLEYQ